MSSAHHTPQTCTCPPPEPTGFGCGDTSRRRCRECESKTVMGQGGRNLVQGAAVRDVEGRGGSGRRTWSWRKCQYHAMLRKVRVLRCRLPSSNRVCASAPSRTSDRLAQLLCPRRSSGSVHRHIDDSPDSCACGSRSAHARVVAAARAAALVLRTPADAEAGVSCAAVKAAVRWRHVTMWKSWARRGNASSSPQALLSRLPQTPWARRVCDLESVPLRTRERS
ncbi:hypothetical protein B0H10DRAFT_664787 [Mycena sp. CBHHK59/15]|nr:hypothetical protein B0H10DRAFT_664787 [Mycena sp. CBHHK59/15]